MRSNTPLSALTGLNETVFIEAARALAQRILREGGADDAARANYAYRLCTARDIKPAELKSVLKLLEENRADVFAEANSKPAPSPSQPDQTQELPPDATPNDIALWTMHRTRAAESR